MVSDDTMADGQSQTHAFADVLSREERIEDLSLDFRIYTSTVVPN